MVHIKMRMLLSEMNVTLLAHTPDPERVCAAAALTSYWYKGASETITVLTEKEIDDILTNVMGYGHVSVIEHATFTFSIEGISRACSHQLVRHRLASYTQQSQRYVKIEDMDPVVPDTIRGDAAAMDLYEKSMRQLTEAYERLVGMGIPTEDARFVLPNASTTNIVMTVNARQPRHFFKFRRFERAQWEIRDVAREMLRLAKAVAPKIFKNAGPSCVCERTCPEGDLSCGRIKVNKDGT